MYAFTFKAKICDKQPGIYETCHLAGILCFTGWRAKEKEWLIRADNIVKKWKGNRGNKQKSKKRQKTSDRGGKKKLEPRRRSIKASLTTSLKGALCEEGWPHCLLPMWLATQNYSCDREARHCFFTANCSFSNNFEDRNLKIITTETINK